MSCNPLFKSYAIILYLRDNILLSFLLKLFNDIDLMGPLILIYNEFKDITALKEIL